MSGPDWKRVSFRLRNVPNHIRTSTETASLLSDALGLPSADHVIIYSLATSTEFCEVPPSRVATLQLKSQSAYLTANHDEWTLPLPGGQPGQAMILDIHFNGMTPLNDVDSMRHCADCIAISGLASHPFGSWQPRGYDKTFMWIRDEVPSIPGIRTAIYGYDTRLAGSDSFQTISDLARTMILHLKTGEWNSPSAKPIIFLAHSLGGLVLKDAIVQMADGDKTIAGILNNIQGAIMFGVPNLGMDQSHLMTIVEGNPNERLLEDVSRNGGNDYLRQLNMRFDGLSFLKTARILWAYETKVSKTVIRRPDGKWVREGPSAVLVQPESATCRYYSKNKSVTIPINEDHSNMVKFSRGDPNLRVIIHFIREICSLKRLARPEIGLPPDTPSDIPEGPQDPEISLGPTDEDLFQDVENEPLVRHHGKLIASVNNIRDRLDSPELDFRKSEIEGPFQNTFKWIFDLRLFSEWLEGVSSLFWIHGKPGSGKSTLMKFVFQSTETRDLLHNWKTASVEVTAGFFFHYRGTSLQKSMEGVLRSLIIQLLAPHQGFYRKALSWDEYQSLKKKQRNLIAQYRHIKNTCEDPIKQLRETDLKIKKLSPPTLNSNGPQGPSKSNTILEKLNRRRKELNRRRKGLKRRRKELKKRRKGPNKRRKEPNERLKELNEIRKELQKIISELSAKQKMLRDELSTIRSNLGRLCASFKPESIALTGKLFTDVTAELQGGKDGLLPKLERTLQILLNQEAMRIDVVLFFDALDEFDGNLNVIVRFLKDLISPTPMTRVKVCFSSRPWDSLQHHFSDCPGFALQDHTKPDIEEYVAGAVESSHTGSSSLIQLIPAIINRANGVFLWVRLAINILFEAVNVDPGSIIPPDILEKKLRDLPDDLFDFYKLIIDRIKSSHRRHTFALIELLIRHDGPPVTATQIRDAVLVSNCSTFQEAKDALELEHTGDELSFWRALGPPNRNEIIAQQQIARWGGGLVEIKQQGGVGRPQLMHQTVLEFAMGLTFKKIVVGNLANILQENGHSFHVKYWSLRGDWAKANSEAVHGALQLKQRTRSDRQRPRYQHASLLEEQKEAMQHLLYHAEQSEITTGVSQFTYLSSIPFTNIDESTSKYFKGIANSYEEAFLSLAASCGLNLCLGDWIARRRIKVGPEPATFGPFHPKCLPLLESLVFVPPFGVVYDRYITTVRLLLENGYPLDREPGLLGKICEELYKNRQIDQGQHVQVTRETLGKIATVLLQHGGDPKTQIKIFDTSRNDCFTAHAVHVAPPPLLTDLLCRGANPNAVDSENRSPLDWALDLVLSPNTGGISKLHVLEMKQQYDKCNILVKAGGVSKEKTAEDWRQAILRFNEQSFDTAFLCGMVEAQKLWIKAELHVRDAKEKKEERRWRRVFRPWKRGS